MPTAGPPMPLRSSSAGDSTEPHATTTHEASTVEAPWSCRPAWVTVASTPVARPSSVTMRSACAPTTARPPASEQSWSQVFIVERLQPCWQPTMQ